MTDSLNKFSVGFLPCDCHRVQIKCDQLGRDQTDPAGPTDPAAELPCYEVMSARHQDVFLTEHVLLLLSLHDVLLLQTLESVGHTRLLAALDQLHPPEPAHAQRGYHLQVVQLHVQLLLWHLARLQQLLAGHVLPILHDVSVLLVPQLGEVAYQLEEGSIKRGVSTVLWPGLSYSLSRVRHSAASLVAITLAVLVSVVKRACKSASMNGFSSFKRRQYQMLRALCNSDVFDYHRDYHTAVSKQING